MRHFAAGLSWCLVGCSPEGGTSQGDRCPPDTATLEVGTGIDAFEPLQDTDPLLFYLGPQGGYHVFGSLQAQNIDFGDPDDPFGPRSPIVTLRVTVDGSEIGQLSGQPRTFEPAPGGGELIGERIVLEVADPPSLDGVPATLSGEVTDRCGKTASDERSILLSLSTGT